MLFLNDQKEKKERERETIILRILIDFVYFTYSKRLGIHDWGLEA